MLRRRISTLLPQISNQPQLLSHLIHELMNFDVSLRDEWGYDGGNGIDGWKGMTWEVLVKKEWFSRWLEVEKNCTLLISCCFSGERRLTRPQLPFRDIKISSTLQKAER